MPAGIILDSTAQGTSSKKMAAIPNPITYHQSYFFDCSARAVLKMVVVNKNFEVLFKTALKFQGNSAFRIDFSDRTKYPNHTSYRLYYSFSASGKPNFASGYGDIRICESPSDWEDCF